MRWLYYRFIYRRLMAFAHRFNWHHTRTCYPDGDTLLVCDWCGLRYVSHRRHQFGDYEPITADSPSAAVEHTQEKP